MEIRKDKTYGIGSRDTNTIIKIPLTSSFINKPETEIFKTISQIDVFNDELNTSNKYRFILNINPVLTNVLTNVTGENSIAIFNEDKFKKIVDFRNEGGMSNLSKIGFKESVSENFTEKDGWVGYYDVKGLVKDCKLSQLVPNLNYFQMDSSNNWVYKLFYIQSKEDLGGLSFKVDKEVDYGGRVMKLIFTPYKHNLNIGDSVKLFGTNKDGEYRVYDLGTENNKFRENYFVIEVEGDLVFTNNSKFSKVINGYPCKYFKRKLSEITSEPPTLIEAGFSTTVFNDKPIQLVYQDSIDLSKYSDYLNRPLITIYLGIFKKNISPEGVEFFTELRSGYDLNSTEEEEWDNINARRINGVDNNNSVDKNILSFTNLTLDVVEFDTYNNTEVKVTDILYTFNTLNRESNLNKVISDNGVNYNLGVRKEGYLYKPFHEIILRETDEVQRTTQFDDTLNYAYEYDKNLFSVKEIRDRSKSTNIIYPFTNGIHYVEDRLTFFLKRQDPFGDNGLLYLDFPSDKIGKKNKLIKNDIKIESPNDEC